LPSFLKISNSSDVIELTDDNFESLTQIGGGSTTGHWLIEFFAPWCGHCKSLAPTYEQVATELKGKINVAKIDATVNKNLATRFGIRGYPTILFFKQNKMIKYNGARTTEKIKEWVLSDTTEGTDAIPPKGSIVQEAVNWIMTTLENIIKIFETYTIAAMIILIFGFCIGFLFCLIFTTPSTTNHNFQPTKNYIQQQQQPPPPPNGIPPSIIKNTGVDTTITDKDTITTNSNATTSANNINKTLDSNHEMNNHISNNQPNHDNNNRSMDDESDNSEPEDRTKDNVAKKDD